MPLFEVKVHRVSTIYYEVAARNKAEAERLYNDEDNFAGEFTEEEEILSVTPVLTDDDEDEGYTYEE